MTDSTNGDHPDVEALSNPYIADQTVAEVMRCEVMAALRVASVLTPAEVAQVAAMASWVKIVGGYDRARTQMLIWEMCNAIYVHVQNGIEFPPMATDHFRCMCADHSLQAERYGQFIKLASAGDHQAVVNLAQQIDGDAIYDTLMSWMCMAADAIAALRFSV